MPFELHTWGPALSLPSIDPDCLAVIAYLRLTLPPDTWVLIPSSDASISPTRDLPALRDGDTVVGGFQNIVDYLARISNGECFSSHIPSHAQSLLSLLLYLSPHNYSHVTRPAYTPLLPWPAQYIIPPQRRTAAQTRCEHLGVQGVEFDEDEKEDGDGRPRGGGGMISDALGGAMGITGQRRSATVTGQVKKHVSGARFRVEAMIGALCGPLTTLLDNKTYLLSTTRPSTADCLALGYLSLLLIPSLPVSWMQELIRQRYPTLSSFVSRGVWDLYGGETNVEEALEGRRRGGGGGGGGERGLPWRKPEVVGAKMAERMIWGAVTDHLPIFGTNIVSGSEDMKEDVEGGEGMLRRAEGFVPAVVAVTTAVAAVAGYLYNAAVNTKLEKEKMLSDMGEAGALFAGLDFGGAKSEGEARDGMVPVGLEVGLDILAMEELEPSK